MEDLYIHLGENQHLSHIKRRSEDCLQLFIERDDHFMNQNPAHQQVSHMFPIHPNMITNTSSPLRKRQKLDNLGIPLSTTTSFSRTRLRMANNTHIEHSNDTEARPGRIITGVYCSEASKFEECCDF